MWPSPACGVAKLRGLGKTPELHLQPSLCLVTLPTHTHTHTQPVGQSPLSVEAEAWTLHMVSAIPRFGLLKDGYLGEGHQAG